jgi:hypothetical protein
VSVKNSRGHHLEHAVKKERYMAAPGHPLAAPSLGGIFTGQETSQSFLWSDQQEDAGRCDQGSGTEERVMMTRHHLLQSDARPGGAISSNVHQQAYLSAGFPGGLGAVPTTLAQQNG